jgi:hypothetical protein
MVSIILHNPKSANPMRNTNEKKQSRREFMRNSTVAGIGFTIVPSYAVSGLGHVAPSDKLNIAGIGIGGKGHANLTGMNSENIVALCDVDWKYSQPCFDAFPAAKRYWDWRKMFDEMGKSIDGVMISTADHTHGIIAAHALTLGKHVYCQKPLTHSIYESRLLTQLAKKYKVATQMGNQGNSGEDVKELCEWIWNGEIGDVQEVHAWTNRPIWPQGLMRPTGTCSLALLPNDPSIPSILPGTGEAGGILEQALLEIWPVMCSTRCIQHLSWAIRQKFREAQLY